MKRDSTSTYASCRPQSITSDRYPLPRPPRVPRPRSPTRREYSARVCWLPADGSKFVVWLLVAGRPSPRLFPRPLTGEGLGGGMTTGEGCLCWLVTLGRNHTRSIGHE